MIHAVPLPDQGAFPVWRAAARLAISHGIAPDRIDWQGSAGLFGGDPLLPLMMKRNSHKPLMKFIMT